MAKEKVVVCIDNSEYMRNGDYSPSRLAAQQKAVRTICSKKIISHPESRVALMSAAGKTPVVEVPATNESGKINVRLQEIPLGGDCVHMVKTMKIAQLVCKKRSDESRGQARIVLFVGSPLKESTEALVKMAKQLKKSNIAVDIINFGETTENMEKLNAFISEVNQNDLSHLLTVPPGPHELSDMLSSSPIIQGATGGSGTTGPSQPSTGAPQGGDSEYELALKLSLQEYERDQQKRKKEQQKGGDENEMKDEGEEEGSEGDDDVDMEDDDELLRRAMELSKMEANPPAQQDEESEEEESDEDEDMDLQMALALSLQQSSTTKPPPAEQPEEMDDLANDEDFLQNVIGNIAGVDKDKVLGKKKDDEKDEDKS